MEEFVKGNLKCHADIHDDFAIKWPGNKKEINWKEDGLESFSTYDQGLIKFKYSEVPSVQYSLAKSLKNYDFINKDFRKEIMNYEKIRFMYGTGLDNYKRLSKWLDKDNIHYKKIWTDEYTKAKDANFNGIIGMEKHSGIGNVKEILRNNRIIPDDLDYIGFTYGSSECPGNIHVLSDNENTYIGQVWEESITEVKPSGSLLKMNKENTEFVVNSIINHYEKLDEMRKGKDTIVSGCLRKLFEDDKSNKV